MLTIAESLFNVFEHKCTLTQTLLYLIQFTGSRPPCFPAYVAITGLSLNCSEMNLRALEILFKD